MNHDGYRTPELTNQAVEQIRDSIILHFDNAREKGLIETLENDTDGARFERITIQTNKGEVYKILGEVNPVDLADGESKLCYRKLELVNNSTKAMNIGQITHRLIEVPVNATGGVEVFNHPLEPSKRINDLETLGYINWVISDSKLMAPEDLKFHEKLRAKEISELFGGIAIPNSYTDEEE